LGGNLKADKDVTTNSTLLHVEADARMDSYTAADGTPRTSINLLARKQNLSLSFVPGANDSDNDLQALSRHYRAPRTAARRAARLLARLLRHR
jgi:single-stranded DNA-binding protein